MKKTFLNTEKPLLTAMVNNATPEGVLNNIHMAIEQGAEAIGMQLDVLECQYRDDATIKMLIDACGDLPVYITSYQNGQSINLTDDECADLLIRGLELGATLGDIRTDYYHREAIEYTFDPEAVAKQKALAAKIHAMGKEVLFSSHFHTFLEQDEVLRVAQAQADRGADILKMVTFAQNEEQLVADMKMIEPLKSIGKPFLFLANGEDCRLLRQTGPIFGVCMYLCRLGEKGEQPRIATARYVRDELMKDF